MKALVLGAGGFVGGELYQILLKNDKFKLVMGLDRNSGNRLEEQYPISGIYDTYDISYHILQAKGKCEFDIIFNCQGWAKPQGDSSDIYYNNVNELVEFLDQFPKYEKPPIFIHLSSIVVKNSPLTVYAASKACSEIVIKSYSDLGKINGIILRPCSINGGDSTHGLIHDMVRKIKNDPTKIDVLSVKPGARKPFIYVNDLVDLMIKLATDPLNDYRSTKGPLNVCSKNSLSVEEVIEIICDTLNINPHPQLNWVGTKWVDQLEVKPVSDFDMMSAETVVKKSATEIWEKINS